MSTSLVTEKFKVERTLASVNEFSAIPHYIFIAKPTSYIPSDATIEILQETDVSFLTKMYDDMILGKRISSSDVIPLTRKIIWQADTVYDQYKSSSSLIGKDYFVATKSGATYFIYKCIENNSGATSTVQPSGTSELIFTTLADGYSWKYMYSISEALFDKFSTIDYMPVVEDISIRDSAIAGSIDSIHVDVTGSSYPNRLYGTFSIGDVAYLGSSTTYKLQSTASNLTNFYINCYIVMTTGAATGEYRRIVDYVVSGDVKLATLENPFTNTPSAGDSYEITPSILIEGDNTEQAEARAILNPTSGILQSIEVLYPGKGYRKATCSVMKDASVTVSSLAEISAAISPPGGHGFDVFAELQANRVGISVLLEDDEGGNVQAANDYRTVGVIKEPQYQNLKITLDVLQQKGSFILGETVQQYKGTIHPGTVSVNTSSNTIVGTGTSFFESLGPGDEIILGGNTVNMFATVTMVSNNTHLQISDIPSWANSAASITRVRTISSCKIKEIGSGFIVLDEVSSPLSTANPRIIGQESSALGIIDFANTQNMTIQTRSINNFLTFDQLDRLDGTFASNTLFIQDEIVSQTSSGATGIVHSVNDTVGTDTVYLLNTKGQFENGQAVIGSTSGGSFVPTNKYNGYLKDNSGYILYVKNVPPISRATNKSERIKIVLES